jgi:hypothetical protein
MYQYELSVQGNFTTIGLSATYPYTDQIYSDVRIDRIQGVNTGTGGRYYFYWSPSTNHTSVNSISFLSTYTSAWTSASITNLKITEMDWLISGFKRYNPGTGSIPSDTAYNGWSYESDNNTFWWTNKPSAIMGATGLATNGLTSSNYLAKNIQYTNYNLSFQYQTFTGSFTGSVYDTIKIQQATDLTSTRTTLYTLTQSSPTYSAIIHRISGLSNATAPYIFFVGGRSVSSGGFQAALTNITIEGGYSNYPNDQFLFTYGPTATYADPTTLSILGSHSYGMAFDFAIGTGSTIGGTTSTIDVIRSQFGNGTFRAGVWENGVWNNGWRVDNAMYEFDDVVTAFRIIADRRWRIQIKGPASAVGAFSIGDRISIGNIVAIDINENRKLLKGYFVVTKKTIDSLIVEIDVGFPFRRIEKDSPHHRIKITKNVWLSGAFLNGYYTGIWNYGLFKGFPRITEMFNTNWIDGIFDGGHFNSNYEVQVFNDTMYVTASVYGLDSSYEGRLGLIYNSPHSYTDGDSVVINKSDKTVNYGYDGTASVLKLTDYIVATDRTYGTVVALESGTTSNVNASGVIQKFRFYDNNIATKVASQGPSYSNDILSFPAPILPESIFQFNSWMDLNYYDTTAVNIGKPVTSYDTGYSTEEYTQNNLYGYPTNDVLESSSTFRDSYSFNKRNYRLGTKYKVFVDGIGDASRFEKPFDMDNFGLKNFTSDGWTYSGTFSTYQRSIEVTSPNTSEDYAIKGEELIITSTMSGSILNNINIDVSKNRYTVVEMDIKTYSVIDDYQTSYLTIGSSIFSPHPIPRINFNNLNQYRRYLLFFGFQIAYYDNMSYLPIYENINHLSTPGLKKYEYFFNKPTLSLRTLGGGSEGVSINQITLDNLKYYEVDMIPFFQYFIDSNIYQGVATPWQGISPFIDYTNSNFSFIDSINIGIGSVHTQQSFTPVSGVGVGVSTTTGGGGVYDNPARYTDYHRR